MKANTMLPLALALSIALFAPACNRDADVAPATEPAVATEPAPVEPAPAPPMPEPAAPPAAPVDSGMTFAVMDKNGDGGLTQDELAATEMLHQHFSVADTDGDGKLTSAEVDAHRAAMDAPPQS